MLALFSVLVCVSLMVIDSAYRSIKFTRYRSHRTGRTLRSSLRKSRFSAARSMGASSVDEVGDTGESSTTTPFVMEFESAIEVCKEQ
jgi:hypothetical protein